MSLIFEGLLEIGIEEKKIPEIEKKIESYIKEIKLFNSAYNLTNTSDYEELVIHHVFDSLAPYKILKDLFEKKISEDSNFKIADIGSGGGFPGIPLALVFKEYDFTLVERMSKRCAFLENCAAILELKNVKVLNSEAEKIKKDSFDFCVFRAFRPLDKKITKTLLELLKPSGILAAYKAKKENIIEEMNGISEIVKNYEIKELNVPKMKEFSRNLLLIQK